MEVPGKVIEGDAVVIGGGISGLAAAKCLKDDGFDVIILERSSDIGGLWTFREQDYGVMSFTHINVSKYNYCFSDFPFPESTPDYPHHSHMAKYIKDYANHFQLLDLVKFNVKVISVEQTGEKWRVTCCKMNSDGKTEEEAKLVFVCTNLAITTGHHARPSCPKFPGQDTFPGDIIHSVDYKDCNYNKFAGERVLVVGIGNSAVDVAVDCAAAGRCPEVYVSTRSGAWVVPNYIMGFATDIYACRAFLSLPRSLANFIFESIVTVLQGSPRKWGLNPKMGALQTQPTVSPTLIHHIQRQNVKIVPNITRIEGRTVHFVNGKFAEFDKIVLCTGYKIDLPFLPETIKSQVIREGSNHIELYKNVFAPSVGSSLAFIGFVQPASGGVLSMSEIQARWFSELCKGRVQLPSTMEMKIDMKKEQKESESWWYQSARHTIQKDPINYCDDIGSMIGVKPDPLTQPTLAWRLLFSTCGTSQYRLVGPHSWAGAREEVCRVPMTDMWKYSSLLLIALLLYVFYYVFSSVYSVFSGLSNYLG